MKTEKCIDEIVKRIKETDLVRSDFVELMEKFNDPFLVLICCILSLRTNDKTTYGASLRMMKLGEKPEDFLTVSEKELVEAIYPVGFYQNKAKQILEISRQLVKDYKSKVPADIDELVKFKGVGRKTANLVMAKGFSIPAICVDVHVHRISNRLGLVKTKSPDETEMVLRKILPQKYWLDINTILVTFGQNICKPSSPKCENCPVCEFCDFYNLRDKTK